MCIPSKNLRFFRESNSVFLFSFAHPSLLPSLHPFHPLSPPSTTKWNQLSKEVICSYGKPFAPFTIYSIVQGRNQEVKNVRNPCRVFLFRLTSFLETVQQIVEMGIFDDSAQLEPSKLPDQIDRIAAKIQNTTNGGYLSSTSTYCNSSTSENN